MNPGLSRAAAWQVNLGLAQGGATVSKADDVAPDGAKDFNLVG